MPSKPDKSELPLDKATRLISALDEAVQRKYLAALADSLRFDLNYVPPTAQAAPATGSDEVESSEGDDETAEGGENADVTEAADDTEDAATETLDEAATEAVSETEPAESAAPPSVMSPQEISEAHGIDIDDLDAYGIVVRRKQIKAFAGHYGRKLRASDVTMMFKTEAYEDFFGKTISRCGNQTKRSATVYSYAEVLQRVGVVEQVKPPRALRELFVQNDVEIPGSKSES
ncbi:MAG: hypothetical protein ACFB4J_06635 [Elainellaceae cyanobacterium]